MNVRPSLVWVSFYPLHQKSGYGTQTIMQGIIFTCNNIGSKVVWQIVTLVSPEMYTCSYMIIFACACNTQMSCVSTFSLTSSMSTAVSLDIDERGGSSAAENGCIQRAHSMLLVLSQLVIYLHHSLHHFSL